MECPNCPGTELQPAMTKQGVEIDYCNNCQGVWFDKNEIYYFTKYPKDIAKKIERALSSQRVSTKKSPRDNSKLVEISYPGGPRIDYCLKTDGLWFDAGELKALLELEDRIHLVQDHQSNTNTPTSNTYTKEWLIGLTLLYLPVIIAILAFLIIIITYLAAETISFTSIINNTLPLTIACIGLSLLARTNYIFPTQFFPELHIASLLKKIKTSNIRPLPCKITGTITEKSGKLILTDQTAEIPLKQSNAKQLNDQKVTITGWFHNKPTAHIKPNTITQNKKVLKNWIPQANYSIAILCIVIGITWGLL